MTRLCYNCGGALAEAYEVGICPSCLLQAEEYSLPVCDDFDERYEFLDDEPRCEGGQGAVFWVKDLRLRRTVALKRLAEDDLASCPARARFLLEAQLASQLHHPGFLPIYDAGLDPQARPFYTTALLSGHTFQHVIRDVHQSGKHYHLKLRRALELFRQVCKAAAYAHSCGVVHRDLKPPNILIGDFGEVFIIDLGSACTLEKGRRQRAEGRPDASTNLSAAETELGRQGCRRSQVPDAPPNPGDGTVPGSLDPTPISAFIVSDIESPTTLAFTPPEALAASPALPAPATDIYALGVTLYELCSGRLPYCSVNGRLPHDEKLVELIRRRPPAPLRQLKPETPRDLAAICEKAMARDPTARYETASALADDLQAFLETRVVSARPSGPVTKLQKWAQRNSVFVVFGSLAFTLVATSALAALRLAAEKNQAKQVTALRSADLAARSGRWQEVINRLAEAESAGYRSSIELSLQRLEAWDALGQPARARAELDRLTRRADLGRYRGAVLLRAGEYQLFDPLTAQKGVENVRAALAAGLEPADKAFAQGLLADNALEALALFREALSFTPYHRGAHRLSLGLEFMLGRQAELDSHLRVFKVLFPEDPSPVAIEATQLALRGRLPEAQDLWNSRPDLASMQGAPLVLAGFKLFAALADYVDLDVALGERQAPQPKMADLIGSVVPILLRSSSTSSGSASSTIRFPQLPCVKAGIDDVAQLIRALLFPLGDQSRAAAALAKEACGHLPEGLIPLVAASMESSHRPKEADRLRAFLTSQAELYALAADSPSMLPKVKRIARFQAICAYFDLLQLSATPSTDAATDPRAAWTKRIREALGSEQTSATECQRYFGMAMKLHELDLAREFLTRWELLDPHATEAIHGRILVELASEAYPKALRLIDHLLSLDPKNTWALEMRREAASQIVKLTQLPGSPAQAAKPHDQAKQ